MPPPRSPCPPEASTYFSKSGTGVLTINTANSYTGGTSLTGGKIVAGNAAALGAAGAAADAGEGTDFHAVSQSNVSLTPLQIDLTQAAQLQTIRQWLA